MMSKGSLVVLLFIITSGLGLAQSRQEWIDSARARISVLLPTYHDTSGITYQLLGDGSIVDVDSSIGDQKIADGHVQDPYGTLHGQMS